MKFLHLENLEAVRTYWEQYLIALRMEDCDHRKDPIMRDTLQGIRIIRRNELWNQGKHPSQFTYHSVVTSKKV